MEAFAEKITQQIAGNRMLPEGLSGGEGGGLAMSISFKKQPLTTGHISWAARKQTASLNTWFSFGGIPTFLTVDSLKRPNTECNQHKASLFTLFWRDYGLLAAIQTNLQVCQTCVFIKTCQNTSKPACVNP